MLMTWSHDKLLLWYIILMFVGTVITTARVSTATQIDYLPDIS